MSGHHAAVVQDGLWLNVVQDGLRPNWLNGHRTAVVHGVDYQHLKSTVKFNSKNHSHGDGAQLSPEGMPRKDRWKEAMTDPVDATKYLLLGTPPQYVLSRVRHPCRARPGDQILC